MSDLQEQQEQFEQEVFELLQKYFPGSLEGDMEPHASACSALAVFLGRLLVWRIEKCGESVLGGDLDTMRGIVERSARAHWEVIQRLKVELRDKFVGGPKTQQ